MRARLDDVLNDASNHAIHLEHSGDFNQDGRLDLHHTHPLYTRNVGEHAGGDAAPEADDQSRRRIRSRS